jgi:hypothetical protein
MFKTNPYSLIYGISEALSRKSKDRMTRFGTNIKEYLIN